MIDKEILEKKKRLQKVRNTLKEISGIEMLCIYKDQNIPEFVEIWDILSKLGYYSNDKIPDDRIKCNVDDNVLYQWIIGCMKLKNGMTVYMMCGDVWVKIAISDVFTAVKDIWNITGKHNGFTIINEDLSRLKECGSDSRDEYNYLYDEYDLTVQSNL